MIFPLQHNLNQYKLKICNTKFLKMLVHHANHYRIIYCTNLLSFKHFSYVSSNIFQTTSHIRKQKKNNQSYVSNTHIPKKQQQQQHQQTYNQVKKSPRKISSTHRQLVAIHVR